MKFLSTIFNTREIALIIFIVIFLVVILLIRKVRKSLKPILKIICSKKLIFPFVFLYIYLFITVILLKKYNFWNFELLKDTLIWVLFSSTAFMFASVDDGSNESLFKKLIKANIKFIIIYEFLLNLYTFPLIIELILVLVFIISTLRELDLNQLKKMQSEKRGTSFIPITIGFIIIAFSVYSIVSNFKNFFTVDTVRSLLLAPVLLVLSFPYFYFLTVYSVYERLFLRVELGIKRDKKICRLAKRRIFYLFKLNLQKLEKALNQNVFNLMSLRSYSDIEEMISVYKREIFNKK